jgi:hypothetical protein
MAPDFCGFYVCNTAKWFKMCKKQQKILKKNKSTNDWFIGSYLVAPEKKFKRQYCLIVIFYNLRRFFRIKFNMNRNKIFNLKYKENRIWIQK